MQLHYTPTIDDLREATTPATERRGRLTEIWPVVTYLCCLGIAVIDVLPPGSIFNRVFAGVAGLPGARPRYAPPQDLWATLVPPLVVVTLLLIPTLVPASVRKNRSAQTLLGLVPFVWFLAFYFPAAAVRWHPTVAQQVAAGLIPWVVYFLIVSVKLIVRRRRTVQAAWDKKVSLRRPHVADVSDEALTVDDGVVLHRYRWAHFGRYRETANLLLVTSVDGGNVILPKRAVTDDDLDRLRSMIQTHVAQGTFLPHDVAFPVVPVAQQPTQSAATSAVVSPYAEQAEVR